MHRCAPVVAEVEHVHELLPGGQLRQPQPVPVDQLLVVEPFRVGFADTGAIGEFELLQMRSVPARERIIDGRCQLHEGVPSGSGEDSPRPRP